MSLQREFSRLEAIQLVGDAFEALGALGPDVECCHRPLQELAVSVPKPARARLLVFHVFQQILVAEVLHLEAEGLASYTEV